MPDLAAADTVESGSASGTGRNGRLAAHNVVHGGRVGAAGGATYERRNPADPREVLGPFPDSGPRDVERAALSARKACADWAGRRSAERAAILEAAAGLAHERAEGIAHVITLETGKPLREARGEAARVATTLRYFAAHAALAHGELYEQAATDGHVYTRRRPRGVVGLIAPWNSRSPSRRGRRARRSRPATPWSSSRHDHPSSFSSVP